MQKHVYMIFSNFPILGTTLELKLFQIQNFLNFKCLDSYISYILSDMKFWSIFNNGGFFTIWGEDVFMGKEKAAQMGKVKELRQRLFSFKKPAFKFFNNISIINFFDLM